jgi:hypothetical protein
MEKLVTKVTKPLFSELLKRIEQRKVKRRLKAAFRRKPKPARVIIPDEDVPIDPKEHKGKNA